MPSLIASSYTRSNKRPGGSPNTLQYTVNRATVIARVPNSCEAIVCVAWPTPIARQVLPRPVADLAFTTQRPAQDLQEPRFDVCATVQFTVGILGRTGVLLSPIVVCHDALLPRWLRPRTR
ncbi:hypothetical protein [Amycolatopsis orientalis]|uniref:hypothetical protein n=1 Tax=Amycolatopsis orientalis TaxID=31958 RepID=UPI001319BB93|nr:hypothetical protein [Amycolatopsis orientalis]